LKRKAGIEPATAKCCQPRVDLTTGLQEAFQESKTCYNLLRYGSA